MPTAAIYARSPRPARGEKQAFQSQTAALLVHAEQRGLEFHPSGSLRTRATRARPQGSGKIAILPRCPMLPHRGQAPRYRVGPAPGARIQQQAYWDI
jgi:hypothetical protein